MQNINKKQKAMQHSDDGITSMTCFLFDFVHLTLLSSLKFADILLLGVSSKAPIQQHSQAGVFDWISATSLIYFFSPDNKSVVDLLLCFDVIWALGFIYMFQHWSFFLVYLLWSSYFNLFPCVSSFVHLFCLLCLGLSSLRLVLLF